MKTPGQRLAVYCAGVLIVLGAIEGAIRWKEPLFVAASHRTLTKAALLDSHDPVHVLFFGSSRTNDGLSPRLFEEELAALRPSLGEVRAFNLASASSSLETLEWLTARYSSRAGLRLAVIEISEPQLQSAPLQWEPPREPPHDLESTLDQAVEQQVRLVAHRRVLFSDNLARLPALLFFAPALDGSEVMVSDQLRAWLGHRDERATGFDAKQWTPALRDGVVTATDAPFAQDAFARIVTVAEVFEKHGVQVAFVVPPLAQTHHPAPEREASMQAMIRALSKQTHAEVWDWSGAVLPEEIFRGTSHLNHAGRAQYSRAMAVQVSEHGLLTGQER